MSSDGTAADEESAVESRRRKVMELSSKGYNQQEIAETLRTSQSTVSRDMQHISESLSANNKETYKRRSLEKEEARVGLDMLIKELWAMENDPKADQKTRTKAASLLVRCYAKKIDSYKGYW